MAGLAEVPLQQLFLNTRHKRYRNEHDEYTCTCMVYMQW